MGRTVVDGLRGHAGFALVGVSGRSDDLGAALGASRPQVLVEFTLAGPAPAHLRTAIDLGIAVVSGTTGIPAEEVRVLGRAAAERGVGLALIPNFALGMVLLQRFAREAARWFPDVEVLELHHEGKQDAPSGTALDTARRIAAARGGAPRAAAPSAQPARGLSVEGVPVHSVRLPGLLAHQEVWFGGDGQVLTLRHDASDRRAYLPGIFLAIRAILGRRGLIDTLDPLLDTNPTG
ncbi:MAG: 4-hydroxy-tetrahydrodipicolinate reductase [Planctomycetes bacterium]|nr:4-hydroxy-tetrahydrodipicolinate reductase [Planctomycetota bacterium]